MGFPLVLLFNIIVDSFFVWFFFSVIFSIDYLNTDWGHNASGLYESISNYFSKADSIPYLLDNPTLWLLALFNNWKLEKIYILYLTSTEI